MYNRIALARFLLSIAHVVISLMLSSTRFECVLFSVLLLSILTTLG
jgi:hypothetical protein